MKYRELAAAIRKGIPSFPVKGYGYGDGCAIQCAAVGLGVHHSDLPLSEFLRTQVKDPTGYHGNVKIELRALISFLNGFHADDKRSPHWTREQIADWLDSLEPSRISDQEYTKRFIDGLAVKEEVRV